VSILDHHGSFSHERTTHRSLAPVTMGAVVKGLAGIASLAALAGLVLAGHPFLAVWGGFLLFAWLFIAGAAIASGN
jgi:hypothetical protein